MTKKDFDVTKVEYKGLFTFDIDNHRYIPIGQADGIVVMNNADNI